MFNVVCSYCRAHIRTLQPEDTSEVQISHGVCEKCLTNLVKDMGQSLEDFLDTLGVPILLVTGDVRVIGANSAAKSMVAKSQVEIGGNLGGNVLGCNHAAEPGGCGKTVHCRECVIRHAVTYTMKTGLPCVKTPAFADIGVISANEKVRFLITTEKRNGMVLLQIEPVDDAVQAAT